MQHLCADGLGKHGHLLFLKFLARQPLLRGITQRLPERKLLQDKQYSFICMLCLHSRRRSCWLKRLQVSALSQGHTHTQRHCRVKPGSRCSLQEPVLCAPEHVQCPGIYQPPHASWASLQPRQRPRTPFCLSVLVGDLCPEAFCLPKTGGGCGSATSCSARSWHGYPRV